MANGYEGTCDIPGSTDALSYPVDNAPAAQTKASSCSSRRLLRAGTVDRVSRGLELAGARDAVGAFLADVASHSAYLDECIVQADEVLRGSLAAANRLWFLLQTRVRSRTPLPLGILGSEAPALLVRAPVAIDGDVLLRLIAGVTRAANQPSEAETMIKVLGQLLQPLFQLELAAVAIDQSRQGNAEMLNTLVTAQVTPEHIAALSASPAALPIRVEITAVPIAKGVLDPDRVPFDRESWRHPIGKSAVENWGTFWPCAGGVHKAMSELDRFGARYQIETISPADGCAGQLLTIRGSGFGAAGRVTFPAPKAGDPIFDLGIPEGVLIGVEPTRWTETEIQVIVPPWATAGDLSLAAVARHQDPCVTIDVYRLGNTAFFKGGLASVYQVSLDGTSIDLSNHALTSLPLGRPVTLVWHTSGGPGTVVRIQLTANGRVLLDRSNLPGGFGSLTASIFEGSLEQPGSGRLTLQATGPCGETQPLDLPVWLSVPPRLTIEYVEVTQGVQTGLAEVIAGNSMPTVANKDTAVRVHMQCDRGGWFSNRLDAITGTLFVDGRKLPPVNVANIRGFSNPNVTNDTLNFAIPAAWLTKGIHTLGVEIINNDQSGKIEVQKVVQWTWHAKDPLRVRVVYMGEGGSDLEMLTYARNALDYLPTDLSNIGIASRRNFTHDRTLTDKRSWNKLLRALEGAWDEADEVHGTRWLGYLPTASVPPESPFSGLSGVPSIAVLAIASAPQTGAHELGHSLGLNHVHLPYAGIPGGFQEPAGPYDNVANSGFLQRAGYDVRANSALPALAADIMSYFSPTAWSTTNWVRLYDGFGDR